MHKNGFTLIEVIIVVIIIGVLAAIAMPRVTNQVNTTKAVEAYRQLSVLMRKVQECYIQNGDSMAGCNAVTALSGYTFPVTPNFTYNFNSSLCPDANNCEGQASFSGTNANAADVITLKLDISAGSITKTKGGIFSTLKN